MSIPQEHILTMQYYPTDFFYSTNAQDMPQGFEGCTILKEENDNNTMCNAKAFDSNTLSPGEIYKCYQSELCKNKKLVDYLYQIRNNHSISQEKYDNISQKNNFEIIKLVNLLVGITITSLFIHYNKQST